jgi:NagD protein
MKKRTAFSVVLDIDGVIRRGSQAIPGAARFVSELRRSGREYLFLTNSPDHSPGELHAQLRKVGIEIPPNKFYTATEAIAEFLVRCARHPTVYVIGSSALREEIRRKGAIVSKEKADFVVVTAEDALSGSEIERAIALIGKGAKFITANCENLSLTATGFAAGNGALISPIEKATGCPPYVIGKPNHLMIRGAEERFGIRPNRSVMIGDNLETDINVGIQAQMTTVLLLSGVTSRAGLKSSPYQPTHMFPSLAHVRLAKLP